MMGEMGVSRKLLILTFPEPMHADELERVAAMAKQGLRELTGEEIHVITIDQCSGATLIDMPE